jgi:hypothetical protein
MGCGYTKYFYVGASPAAPPPPGSVGLAEEKIKGQFSVFPNPANDAAYLFLAPAKIQSLRYTVTDVNGRMIMSRELKNVSGMYEKIDVSEFSSGVYFVRIEMDDRTSENLKMVIQR